VNAWLEEPHQIVKIEAFDRYEQKVIEAKKYLPPIEGIALSSSFIDNVEVTDKAAQKGLILDQVIQDVGISREEVAVFGDGLNDLTMFQLFPESYAMNNGDEEIKKLAKYIAPDCNDEGVAQMVEKILEKQ
jgi:HAD superfamily hydrolase (TIGR01484 family)